MIIFVETKGEGKEEIEEEENCLIKDILNHNSCVLFSDNSVISMVQETAKKFQFGEEGSEKQGANETCEKQ